MESDERQVETEVLMDFLIRTKEQKQTVLYMTTTANNTQRTQHAQHTTHTAEYSTTRTTRTAHNATRNASYLS